MKLDILHVPGCPGAAVLHTLLTPILAEHSDLQVTWHIVHNEDQARQQGMTGSPTLLVNGTDPFARPGQQPTLMGAGRAAIRQTRCLVAAGR